MVQLYHMTFSGKKATLLLLLGDIIVFALSLWVTLFLRYGNDFTADIWRIHATPFAALFFVWALVFYMAGLYGKEVTLFKSKLPSMILRTQMLNIVIAALFFFLLPGSGITPKTNLAIYLVISLAGIYFWRITLFPKFFRPGAHEGAALLASGEEANELKDEVQGNTHYPYEFRIIRTPSAVEANFAAFAEELEHKRVSIVVVDMSAASAKVLLAKLYELSSQSRHSYRFVDFYRAYEEVFDRVPLSVLTYDWFLKNVSTPARGFYAFAKRTFDVAGALTMAAITLILIPFVYVAMRIEGPGPLFLRQERFGLNGSKMIAYKFRSMRFDNSASSEWVKEERENRVTRVGAVLRKTSLDEFPQFINVLRGELSLIGPRNDIWGLGERLARELPYYTVRYMVKPGLTGWAQINQQYEQGNISPQSIEETKTRLAYDFYYIKHRSLALDIIIALKTFKRMLLRVGGF